jgi:Holliday junction DNA helicase RuvB
MICKRIAQSVKRMCESEEWPVAYLPKPSGRQTRPELHGDESRWAEVQVMGRPLQTFQDFIGQRRVVRHLERLIRGAQACGEPVVPLLLIARSGCGKTALAKAVAAAYGSKLHGLVADHRTRASRLCAVLRELRHGDMFFIDEAHALGRDAQQVLYLALDEQRVPAPQRDVMPDTYESIARFTLVLATNEPGTLKSAFCRRLVTLEFDTYSARELREIAEREATDRGLTLSPQAAGALSAVAQGSPGRVARLIQSLRHYWPDQAALGTDDVRRFVRSEGIDANGLTPLQRQYLRALAAAPGGRRGLEGLAVKLGCDARYVRLEVEPYLIEQELVEISSERGRAIMTKGFQLANELDPCENREDNDDPAAGR